MVDNDVLRLNVSMHNAYWVGIVQSFENLIDIKLAISRLYGFQDGPIVGLVNMFEDKAIHFALFDYI